MMKTKKPRYKGKLAKPICVGSIPIKGTYEEQQVIDQVIEQEAIEKLPLLIEHYKMIPDRDNYFRLALALAIDHVPGFRVVPAKLRLKGSRDPSHKA